MQNKVLCTVYVNYIQKTTKHNEHNGIYQSFNSVDWYKRNSKITKKKQKQNHKNKQNKKHPSNLTKPTHQQKP